jgi:hypothetical protein
MLAGKLREALSATESALAHVELAGLKYGKAREARDFALKTRSHVWVLLGELQQAAAYYRTLQSDAAETQDAASQDVASPIDEESPNPYEPCPFCREVSFHHLHKLDPAAGQRFVAAVREWALPGHAVEPLVWALMATTTTLSSRLDELPPNERGDREKRLWEQVEVGVQLARDSGFGLYFINLLLEQARLRLRRGDADGALQDLRIALDDGLAANEQTGLPELLAANHEACGFAWAIAEGLHVRGEAWLLEAARMLGKASFDPAYRDQLPTEVFERTVQAETCLNAAMNRWRDLRAPETMDGNNFRHPESRREYDHRAAETYRVLHELGEGVLTRYPLSFVEQPPGERGEGQVGFSNGNEEKPMIRRFHVALSFPGEYRDFVHQVAEALAAQLSRERVFYDEWYEVELLGAGGDLKLQAMYDNADLVVPFFSKYYDKPWCSMEWETIRGILLNRRKEDAVIPVHLDDTDIPGWSAVNFGIRLRGRSPQEIAGLILQALAMRRPGANTTTESSSLTATTSQTPTMATPPSPSAQVSNGALAIWREKLDYLQQQEAITSDHAQKFSLKKQIEEVRQKIQELSANTR